MPRSPRPPPPMAPAMAEYPIRLIMVTMVAATRPGRASGSSTFMMICSGLAPMARAAVSRPESTSRMAFSAMRAMNGMAATDRGTMAAVVPIEVCAISRVNGMMATIRMMKGTERVMLTTAPSERLTARFWSMAPRAVTTSTTPMGMPTSTAMRLGTPTSNRVSSSEVASSSISCGLMCDFFYRYVLGGQRRQGLPQSRGRALRQHEQRADGDALDVFDAGLHQADIERVLARQVGQQRAGRGAAGQPDAQQAHHAARPPGLQFGHALAGGGQGSVGQVRRGGGRHHGARHFVARRGE